MLGEPPDHWMLGKPSDHWMLGSSSSKLPLPREFQVTLYRVRPSRFPPSSQRPPPLLIQNRPDRLDLFDSKPSLVHPAAEIEQGQEDSQDAQISWKDVFDQPHLTDMIASSVITESSWLLFPPWFRKHGPRRLLHVRGLYLLIDNTKHNNELIISHFLYIARGCVHYWLIVLILF